MHKFFNQTIITMSVAVFSMFFGAGNAIFPLILGMQAKSQFIWAFFGLVFTAIGGPLLGLLGGTLFEGKCVTFFRQSGKIPGSILFTVTCALLGPVAVLPRCVTVSYAAISPLFPTLSMSVFAFVFCLLALFFCWKRHFLLPALGYLLSPALIACLLLIIFQGVTSSQPMEMSSMNDWEAFSLGFSTGYDTMDLIASIYFSSGIWALLSARFRNNPKTILKTTLTSAVLGCCILAFIYFGLTAAAARFSSLLLDTAPEQIMTRLAALTLSPSFAIAANIAIALACLTTVTSLVMTISEILSKEILSKLLSYRFMIILNLLITTIMANVGFSIIMKVIHTALLVCYPIIILLTIYNIFYKLRQRS